jgi:2-keto-3-deoxy-L-rhamnonate aldolase RhmA
LTDSFKTRLQRGDKLASTFVKTASHQNMEVLCGSGLDFVVIDAEHAPFSVTDLDVNIMAARSRQMPVLVRVPDAQAATLLQVLDMGAQGLLIPHAKTPEGVRADLEKTRYVQGTRGFSNSPRAGMYGKTSMADHVRQSDEQVTCIFQIEDAQAVDLVDQLAQIPEVTGYLIGRADLAVSLGSTDIHSPVVSQAVAKVAQACQKHGKPLGIFVTDVAEIPPWLAMGMSFFIIGSDQSYLSRHATGVAQAFSTLQK